MDAGSDSPYESVNESAMTQNNIGSGFESGYTANYVEENGDPTTGVQIPGFRTLTGLTIQFNFAGNCDNDDCAAKWLKFNL